MWPRRISGARPISSSAGARRVELARAAGAPSPDPRPRREIAQRAPLPGDENVARIGALEDCRDPKAGREARREVLRAVDGDVHLSLAQRGLDLRHERAAAEGGERNIAPGVAGRPDPLDAHLEVGPALAECVEHQLRLRERERAPASADGQHAGLSGPTTRLRGPFPPQPRAAPRRSPTRGRARTPARRSACACGGASFRVTPPCVAPRNRCRT
jgi:hypothetical protein